VKSGAASRISHHRARIRATRWLHAGYEGLSIDQFKRARGLIRYRIKIEVGGTMDSQATYRGMIYPWQCDHVGHMNVMVADTIRRSAGLLIAFPEAATA
jgi:hypothetical protein